MHIQIRTYTPIFAKDVVFKVTVCEWHVCVAVCVAVCDSGVTVCVHVTSVYYVLKCVCMYVCMYVCCVYDRWVAHMF